MLRELRLELLKEKIRNTACREIIENDKEFGIIRCGITFAQDGDLDVVRFCENCNNKRNKLRKKEGKLERAWHMEKLCVVCGEKAYCRIGTCSNLVCWEHAEEYQKGNKKVEKIIDQVTRRSKNDNKTRSCMY